MALQFRNNTDDGRRNVYRRRVCKSLPDIHPVADDRENTQTSRYGRTDLIIGRYIRLWYTTVRSIYGGIGLSRSLGHSDRH